METGMVAIHMTRLPGRVIGLSDSMRQRILRGPGRNTGDVDLVAVTVSRAISGGCQIHEKGAGARFQKDAVPHQISHQPPSASYCLHRQEQTLACLE
jgi:hypothetical protein